MKNKKKRRVISVVMSFLMLISVMPADFGAVAVKASTVSEEKSAINWGAKELIAATNADKGVTLHSEEGDPWTLDSAKDKLTFEDGFAVEGDNVKAGKNKAKTGEVSAAGTVPDSGSYLQYDATSDGSISVYTKIGAGKIFYIVGSDGSKTFKENKETTSSYSIVKADVKTGVSYYAYLGGATAQIWKAVYEPVSNETQVDWSQVAVPKINSVDVNEDGNFVVDFSAVVNKISGADDVRVTMCYDGNEVDSVKLTAQKSQVIFTPGWGGDYTFKVVAQRLGQPDKASEEYIKKDYVLAVPKPVIEMAQNLGSGSVYLDWINVEDADTFDVAYKTSESSDYTVVATAIKDGNYTLKGLTSGKEYDFKISAVRNSDGYRSVFEKKGFTVTPEAEQKWYFATVGSAQETNAQISDGSTVKQTVALSSKDTDGTKKNVVEGQPVANTSNKLTIQGSDSGKISDGEEGFQYYYTMINPNTQNFELSATFKITDTSLTPDNQTGFGLIATDMLGINYYGSPDYVHKYFNSVSNQAYSVKSAFLGMRVITGYDSVDTTSYDGVTRNTDENRYKDAKASFDKGTTYTFTLKKTNDAYVASYNGEEKTYSDLSALSVQEDGSICVGVFVARKVTAEITDMKFTTSESTGVGSGSIEKKITPSAQIMSSETTGTSDYQYIYYPNIAGKLTVNAPDGSKLYDSHVDAYQVVRVNVPLTVGKNTITSALVPDESQSLTSYNNINKSTAVDYQVIGTNQDTLYVSPDGKADGDGSKDKPLDVYTAVKYAHPGQYIVLLNGTYTGSDVAIGRSVSGTEQNPITMVAEDANKVIFEGVALNVTGSYWHIYGIYIHYPNSVGIQISGNYNTIEMCTVEGSKNTGIQISRAGGAENKAGREEQLWPSYNLVKNSESFDNCDPGRNDADGFAAKLTSGDGNKFYGCISHNNIDDGWDLFAKTISGEIGAVTIENSVTYDNGWLTTDDTSAPDYVYGEGNGFKLGGSYMKGGHILKNSVSFNNHGKGITSNSCPDVKIYNSTSYHNSINNSASYNVGLNTKASNLKEWVVEGLISMADAKDTTHEDMIPFSLLDEDNYFYNGASSYNNQGVEAVSSWFENTDVTKTPTRNADGTINMNGLLVLNDSAPAKAGGRLDVTSDTAKSVKPVASVKPSEPGTKPDDGNQNPTDGSQNPGNGNGSSTDGQGGTQTPVDNNGNGQNQPDNQPGQNSDNAGNTAVSTSQSTPATGDTTPLAALIIFVVISGGAFVKFILSERKRRRQ